MTKKDERDASVDRLLPSVLEARATDAGGRDCLDAETLAAWADAALDGRARADAEAHAANCARCQAMLAAMVRTAPSPVAAASASPWRSRSLWWMAALAPAAIALVVWFAVPTRVPVQRSDDGAQAVDQIAAEPSAPRAQAPDKANPLSSPPLANERRASAKDNVAQSPTAPLSERDVAPIEQKSAAAPPASAGANAMADARVAGAAAAGAAPEAPPASAVAAPSPRREAFAASARASTFASELDRQIVSSNPSTRFRLLRGGGVQRSADGGATWRNEVTGATETLTVGSSPSPSVCWLVGRSGAVFLSTDGRSWRRVPFPEAVDLDAVIATDSENASVRTADGRLFATTDGGRTWTRSPDF